MPVIKGMSLAEHRAMTERHREQVAHMTRNGYSASEIAAALGVHVRTVQRHRRATGVAKPAARPLTSDEKRRAHALLMDGASYAEVARTLGRDDECLRKHFPGYTWTKQQQIEYMRTLLSARKKDSAA